MGSFTFGITRRYGQLGGPTSFTFGQGFFCPLMKKESFLCNFLPHRFRIQGGPLSVTEQQDNTSSFLSQFYILRLSICP